MASLVRGSARGQRVAVRGHGDPDQPRVRRLLSRGAGLSALPPLHRVTRMPQGFATDGQSGSAADSELAVGGKVIKYPYPLNGIKDTYQPLGSKTHL
jgi:hypothetical protein